MIPLFRELAIETASGCTRVCPTCLRTTYPEKAKLEARFNRPEVCLPTQVVKRVIDEAIDMGFHGILTLDFYNEPLMDAQRVGEFARHAKERGRFEMVHVYSNGDLLKAATAADLDGALDQIEIALYAPGPGGLPRIEGRTEREAEIRSCFHKTRVVFTGGAHKTTHFSPISDLESRIDRNRVLPCIVDVQETMIIGHTGQMLLCCDDIGAEFDLGSVNHTSLYDLWYGQKHQEIVTTLSRVGGRENYPYCRICPKDGTRRRSA